MGLIGNKFRDGTGLARAWGDVPAISVPRRTSDWGNTQSPDDSAGDAGASYPQGLGDGAWFMPQISGEMALRIEASGGASGDIYAGQLMTVTMTGAGAIAALAALAVSMDAGLTGSGGISSATITGLLDAVAALSGSGGISGAAATALGNMVAALSGSGGASGTIGAIGDMELDIVVTGTGLSTANVGQAVWSKIVESGFTAEEIMRLLAAAMAGKVSGASGTTITFRDLGDTKDRIVATVDASGNRSAVTRDVT